MGGSSAPAVSRENPALNRLQAMQQTTADPRLQGLMSQFGQGGLSLQDALNQARQLPGSDVNAARRQDLQQQIAQYTNQTGSSGPNSARDLAVSNLQKQLSDLPDTKLTGEDLASSLRDQLVTDPLYGSRIAADEVRSNPLTSGLFGSGGIQDQSQALFGKLGSNLDEDRSALQGRDQSYGLTPEDLAAYGQISGNIARQFGAAGNNLAQSLSDRGLASAPNGVAASQFSGLLGNQNEQLANAQLNIAQNRINTARGLAQARTEADLSRQAQNNSLMQGLGQLGQSALSNQWNRQMSGSENSYNRLAGAAGLNADEATARQNQENTRWAQQQQSGFNPMSFLGAALGNAAGSFTGAAGSNLADRLFPTPPTTPKV